MEISSIFKCSLTIILVVTIFSQSVLASLKDTVNNTCIPHDDWQYTNVFIISHGYSDEIDNQSGLSICFKKNVNINIQYSSLFPGWLDPRIKVWDSTGLIEDFNNYGFSINVKNFTGIIIHRDGIFRERWNLYGYCSILQIHTPDY